MSRIYDRLGRKKPQGGADSLDLFEFGRRLQERHAAGQAARTPPTPAMPVQPEPPPPEPERMVEEPAALDIAPGPVPEPQEVPVPLPEPAEPAAAEPEAEPVPEAEPEAAEPVPLPEPEPVELQAPAPVPPAASTPPPWNRPAKLVSPLADHKPWEESPVEGGPPSSRSQLIRAAAVVGVILIGILLIGVIRGISRGRTPRPPRPFTTAAAVVEKPVPAVPASARPAPAAVARPAPVVPSFPALKVRGARVTTAGSVQIVVFERGIFSGGTRLAIEGRSALREIGRQLAPHRDRLSVTVIGCTDNERLAKNSHFKSNRELGLRRAQLAADVLRETSGAPASAFQTLSYGQRWAPYPNDTAENRARNRTAVLRISVRP